MPFKAVLIIVSIPMISMLIIAILANNSTEMPNKHAESKEEKIIFDECHENIDE